MNMLGSIMRAVYIILLSVSLIIGIGLIIINGYKIMSSEGDPRKVQEGQEGLTSALLGLLFSLGSLAIIRIIVGSILGTGTIGSF